MYWLKKLLKKPDPPPVPAVKYQIPPYPGAKFNICLTTLLTPKTAPAWTQGNLIAAPWTKVLALPAFDLFRAEADNYYKSCDSAGALLPTVTRYGPAIRIAYDIDNYVFVAYFEPGELRMGYGEKGGPIVMRAAKGVIA